jgi:hypothetical protein
MLRPWHVLGIYAVLLALYVTLLHPWLMNWGATEAEQRMALPGDEVATSPNTAYFTRAITINAPADEVWPWIVQIGQDRAGFYSNDWLENIFLADIHNANVIHREWQRRQLGDVVPLVPPDYLGGLPAKYFVGEPGATIGPHIWLLQPGRAIADTPGRFVLMPIDDHTTRLLLRESIEANTPGGGAPGVVAGRLVWDPMHFVMVQQMLQGIKERAEGEPLVPPALEMAARIGWVLAGLGLTGLFLMRRRGYLWLLIPLAAASPSLALTGDPNAALAGFLAAGITVWGMLVFGRRWWAGYALIMVGVLLVLVLAPDAYVVFGVLFDLMIAAVLLAVVRNRRQDAITGTTLTRSCPEHCGFLGLAASLWRRYGIRGQGTAGREADLAPGFSLPSRQLLSRRASHFSDPL